MMGFIRSLLTLALVLCATAPASGQLVAFWRNNPITPAAIADDPILAGMQSWSLMITNPHNQFLLAGLRAELGSGQAFYRNPLGINTLPDPDMVFGHPALEFDTYVTMPADRGGGVWSPGYGPYFDVLSFGGPLDPAPGVFSVRWGTSPIQIAVVPGTYEIARLTFPTEMFPTIHPGSFAQYGGSQFVFIPTTIPEPAALLSNIAVIAVLPLRRRRA